MNPSEQFEHDERLGLRLPAFNAEWASFSHAQQEAILAEWERIKARIPDRVKELEAGIDRLQIEAAQEDDWDRVCDLYEEIYRVASIINDLNIWNGVEPHTTAHEAELEPEPRIAEEHTTKEK
ncbi:MAG TPA: hypothetical protein VFV52_13315 [Bacilli bacterium]|nr:hypothetical protein [Bacilli bacterium]